MSHPVVVGPTTIRGPGGVEAERVAAALKGIDDDLVLVDERVVPADQVWCEVLHSALGGRCDDVVLVCPSWWATPRVARVEAAARLWCAEVTVRRRVEAVRADATVVEVAPELVVVHGGTRRHAVARVGETADVVGAVVACVDGLGAVTVDVPTGLEAFGAELTLALRRRHVDVSVVDDQALSGPPARDAALRPAAEPASRRLTLTPRAAVLAGAVVATTALAAAAVVLGGGSDLTVDATETTWLVEGRVAVQIPARWTVERITSGPGSARVQVTSPSEAFTAIQVTQSRVPNGQTLDTTAEALRLALAGEPEGVFVNFTAPDRRAQRTVVTYREIRADHEVSWAVMLDRGVRIAIGCQVAAGGDGPVQFCDRAIQSAHGVA